ncbi:hypothetical protein GF359_09445 [candidate division WOR-3 bacterium]|uniref:4-vinyl reductase 4VR domain-containing protein n=1 Tax=candidate division WOR-3 bacterium TaxID=2052148 RepID=A0A9D5KAR4_UNCW3|nr:hypothetical protein [candidate division WOR-3 bacterium]MBD3365423.1 hypothetical protein [candidate division WOR-3 bacterium]
MDRKQSVGEIVGSVRRKHATGNDKGDYFEPLRMWVVDTLGKASLKRLKELVGAEIATPLDGADPDRWYPTAYSARLYEALYDLVGKDEEKIRDFARFYLYERTKGFMRVLMTFASPMQLALRVGRMWQRFHDTGRAQVEIIDADKSETRAKLTILDWWASPANCLVNTFFYEEMVRIAGGKHVYCEETHCVHRGDDFCRWEIGWQ